MGFGWVGAVEVGGAGGPEMHHTLQTRAEDLGFMCSLALSKAVKWEHFAGEETEAQRESMTGPKSQSGDVAELGLPPGLFESKLLFWGPLLGCLPY